MAAGQFRSGQNRYLLKYLGIRNILLYLLYLYVLYQRRLYLRDAIYEVLDTHLRDSSIVYYEYFWILLETSRNYKICSSGLAAADVDLQDCLAR